MSTVETAVASFVWHECLSTDVEKSKSFYTELLGWEIEVYKPGEIDYSMISAGGTTHGGFQAAQGGAPSHWMGHVAVDDIDAAVARAEGAGGTVVAPRMDMPEVGAFAVIADPQGATFSIYQPAGEGPVAQGVFVWDELLALDVEGAKSFYGAVFGWTATDMDMGEQGPYTMFRRAGDVDAAGMLKKPDGQPPAAWVPYLATDDVAGTVKKATDLGATAFVPATDVPNVGTIAVVADPTGAVFGLFKPNQPSG
jgi:uncharacterized protein